jgi:hypothetical protein
MAFSSFVGSFTVPAATGNKATTGVGFQPKVVFFWGNGQTSDAAVAGSPSLMAPHWGIGISSTSRVAMFEADDGVTGNPTGTDATKCIKRALGATPTVTFAADLVSLDSDGFTVNFTTANATAFVVNYLAWGGSDLSGVSLVSFTSATGTGNQATTGAGFAPDVILLLGADTSASNNSTVMGLGKSSSARGTSAQAANATTGGRIEKTTKVYCNIDGGSSVRCEADLVTLDSNGFTLNWTTASANTHTIYALCLKGGSFKVGAFTQKTSSGSQATTGVGFTPTGLLSFSVGQTAGAAIGSIQYIMTGAAASSTKRAAVEYSSGAVASCALDRTHVYISYADNATPTTQGLADLTSFDADGFTLNYGTADATAREVIYLAVGNAPPGIFVPRNTYQAPILTQ